MVTKLKETVSFENVKLPGILSSSTPMNGESSMVAHWWLWGLDHPLLGPFSTCDVKSCTVEVGEESQKVRKPGTKQH